MPLEESIAQIREEVKHGRWDRALVDELEALVQAVPRAV
jgi:hypothetical protein